MKLLAKVDSRGRITIPKKLRDKFEITKGDEVQFDSETRTFKKISHEVHEQLSDSRKTLATDWDQLQHKLSRVFGPMGVGGEAISAAIQGLRGETQNPDVPK